MRTQEELRQLNSIHALIACIMIPVFCLGFWMICVFVDHPVAPGIGFAWLLVCCWAARKLAQLTGGVE